MVSLPESSRLKLVYAVLATVVCLFLSVVFTELYQFVAPPKSPWLGAAIANSVLSILVLLRFSRQNELHGLLDRGDRILYGPGLLIGIGALVLGLASRFVSESTGEPAATWTSDQMLWILWVPVVEEIVFRAGLQSNFATVLGPVWATWFTSLLFALVHAQPSWQSLVQGQIGIPLGPFFLGLITGSLFSWRAKLLPCIFLHAVCNATPLIFAWTDRRWLEWLGFLYQ